MVGKKWSIKGRWDKKAILLLIVVSLLICGCAKKENEVASEDKEREKLVLWSYYETEAQQKALDTLMKDFNRSQNTYEASWKYVPMTEFTKNLSIGVTEEDLPDMVIIDNPDMKTYINLGMFADITPYIHEWNRTEDYYVEVLSSVKKEEAYYGLPICCNNLGLIYNQDMLELAGLQPPGNWEELLICAQKLSTEKTYGFAMSALEGEQCSFQAAPWILSAGKMEFAFAEEACLSAFTKMNTLLQNGYMDRNCVNWSQVDIARKFVAGEAAMMENGPWVLSMLEEANMSFGIVPLPVGEENRVLIGGENLGVIKGKNVDGAVTFLKYYNQDTVMQKFCKEARVLPPKRSLAVQEGEDNPKLMVFVKQMDTALSRSSFSKWSKISMGISDASYQLFTGEKTPEEIAEQLNTQWKE